MSTIDVTDGKPVQQLYLPPPQSLWDAAASLPLPALIYDFDALRQVARAMRDDIALVPGARLNLALKACHTPAVLRRIAELGLGCDVASPGELALARDAGFDEISATGPAFSEADFRIFRDAGIVPDVDSLSQLELYGRAFPGAAVGLRLRLPLAPRLESNATFGAESRFGLVVTDERLARLLGTYRLRVTRLHVHTGQMSPDAALYKLDYLLAAAEVLTEVDCIDMGGGMFHFYVHRARARAALAAMAGRLAEFAGRQGRQIALRFEPGGALLAPCGYLAAEVRAVEEHPHLGQRVVTVNASAWNIAPWHKPQVFVLPDRGDAPRPGLVAGNTLYEHDFFARDVLGRQEVLEFPECRVGDRLLITAAGAYTMTNGRRFNRIPMPREFAIEDGRVMPLAHVDGAC